MGVTDEVDIARVLAEAVRAGERAALSVWVRDGRTDRGSCGGAMLELDGRTRVAREAERLGLVHRMGREYWLSLRLPDDIRSQNADIPQAQYQAFRQVLEDAGLAGSVKRNWTYVD